MASTSNPFLEEAANVAMESVSSLDNLPNEVLHILAEIRHLDKKYLQADIAKDQARYLRHSLRQSKPGSLSRASSFGASETAGTPNGTPGGSRTAKLPGRIAANYGQIDSLSSQKVNLAQRLVELLTRAQSRLDIDVAKVRTLHDQSGEEIRAPAIPLPALYPPRKFDSLQHPSMQISESLRGALNGTFPSADSMGRGETPSISVASQHGNKKRRLSSQQSSVKLKSSSNSRPGKGHPKRKAEPELEDHDMEGEEGEAADEEEDSTLYCFCQKQSFGDMIGCDNPECPYQWFHIECVGVKTPLPDKWYCPECIKNMGHAEKRRGRKRAH